MGLVTTGRPVYVLAIENHSKLGSSM